MPKIAASLRGVALAALAGAQTGCASAPPRPPEQALELARSVRTYSAEATVRLKGPSVRARARALVAFERPRSLRVEVPGPGGARFVLVARGDELTAAFPAERAVYRGGTTAAEVEALLGIALEPFEIMGLLAGSGADRLVSYRVWWGERLPEKIEAKLEDGTRLDLRVSQAEADVALPVAAFQPPSTWGYRSVTASEARGLWAGR